MSTVSTIAGKTRFRRITIGVAAVAPIVFLAGQAVFPSLPREPAEAYAAMAEAPGQLLAARLLTAAGAFGFLCACGPLLFLAPAGRRGATVTTIGVLLFGAGTFFNGLSQTVHAYAVRALTESGLDDPAGVDALLMIDSGAEAFVVSYWSVPVFVVGLLTLLVGLVMTGRLPIWLGVGTLVAVLLAFAMAGVGALFAVAGAPFVAGFVTLMVLSWRHGYPADCRDLAGTPS